MVPVQASLDVAAQQEAAGAARMLASAMQHQQAAADADGRGSAGTGAALVATPGLQNRIGEYNCFLNVIIQCLWQCGAFRARLLQLAPQQLAVGPRPACSELHARIFPPQSAIGGARMHSVGPQPFCTLQQQRCCGSKHVSSGVR